MTVSKKQKQRVVPAGEKSTLVASGMELQHRRQMPTKKGYSDEVKVCSPASRSI